MSQVIIHKFFQNLLIHRFTYLFQESFILFCAIIIW